MISKKSAKSQRADSEFHCQAKSGYIQGIVICMTMKNLNPKKMCQTLKFLLLQSVFQVIISLQDVQTTKNLQVLKNIKK